MSTEEKKYRYADKLWTWRELEDQLDRIYVSTDFSKPSRLNLALNMVEGEDVLDLGCHVAFQSYHLACKGHKVVGADVDGQTLEIARRKFPHPNLELVKLESAGLDFEDNSFDTVLLLEVLEHSDHPRGLVRQIHRVLRPGGFLILSVPNAASYHTLSRTLLLDIKSYFRKMETWPEFAYDQRDHFFYWDPFTLYRLLNKQGFLYVEHKFSDNFKSFNLLACFIPPLRRISSCFIIKVRK